MWPFRKKPIERRAPGLVRRSFNAGRIDRLTSSWLTTNQSINTELRDDLDRVRSRARDLVINNDFARRFQKMVISNVVGSQGFILQAQSADGDELDARANRAIEQAFSDWARRGVCEISGRSSFVDVQRAIVGGLPSDGEYLVRMIKGGAARNRYGFALQLIDIDRLKTSLNQNAGNGQNAIRMGVEIDAFARPVAYHVMTAHPAYNSQAAVERIPADQMLHDFVIDRAEQLRGAPWMATAMLSLHHLGQFEQSALLAARKGADTLGFFVSPNGEPPLVDDEIDGQPITVSVPGTYDTLPEGYDFKAYDSRYPDAMLADFNKYFLRRVASGLGVAYNSLANDLEGVNYSSIRAGVLEERDQWMAIQSWFIESFLRPVFASWLGSALLSGAITLPGGAALPPTKREKFTQHNWQGRRWSWVDPLKDIQAARLAIQSGVTSPQRVAAQMGNDVDDVLAEIARFEQTAGAVQSVTLAAAGGPENGGNSPDR